MQELPADIAVDPTFITVDEMPKAPLLLEGPASVPLQSSAGDYLCNVCIRCLHCLSDGFEGAMQHVSSTRALKTS